MITVVGKSSFISILIKRFRQKKPSDHTVVFICKEQKTATLKRTPVGYLSHRPIHHALQFLRPATWSRQA